MLYITQKKKIYPVNLENNSFWGSNRTKPDINCALNIVNNYREHSLTKSYQDMNPLTKSAQAQLANRLYCLITRNIHFASNNVHSTTSLLNWRFSITRHIAKVYLTILCMRTVYSIIFQACSRANVNYREVVQERVIGIIIIIITLWIKLFRLISPCIKMYKIYFKSCIKYAYIYIYIWEKHIFLKIFCLCNPSLLQINLFWLNFLTYKISLKINLI